MPHARRRIVCDPGGHGQRGARPSACLDFSDSYELALILGREGLSAEAVLAEFVSACVDAYAPGPPYRTYWIHVVSLHAPYRP